MKIWNNEKKNIIFILISSFIIGLLAYGFMFLNGFISHDSLGEFIYPYGWKLGLGRVFAPFYVLPIKGNILLPFVSGILGILYLSISTYIISKIFDIKNRFIICLTSAFLITNVSIISLVSTFLGDFETNMFGVLLSTLSVLFFTKGKKWKFLGCLPLCISIGIYQSNISITISLLMIYFIKEFIYNKDFKSVLINGLKSIGMILLGCILYYISLKIIPSLAGVNIVNDSYNSVNNIDNFFSNNILVMIFECYKKFFYNIIFTKTILNNYVMAFINLLVYIPLLFMFIKNYLFNKKYDFINKLFVIIIILLLPIGMNVAYFLCGMSHDLMHFSFIFIFLLLFIFYEFLNINNFIKKSFIFSIYYLVLLFSLIFINIKTSNSCFMVKMMEYDANLSYYTRVLSRIESMDDYKLGETKVCFVNYPNSLVNIDDYKEIYEIFGMDLNSHTLSGGGHHLTSRFFKYVLHYPINIVSDNELKSIKKDERVINMNSYPSMDSIKFIDDVLVVKNGD